MTENTTSQLSDEKLWLISLSSILTHLNNDDIWNLPFSSMDDEINKAEWRKGFINSWGITNREEFDDILTFLDTEGHNTNYLKESNYWGRMTKEKCEKILARTDDETLKRKVRLMNTHYMALRDKGIYAWDSGRYAHVVRWGYFTGMISENEAWEKLLYNARKTQPLFNSWDEFGLSYTVGWAIWSQGDLTQDFCEQKFSIFKNIITYPNHPWNKIEWNLPLPNKI